jgi:sulfate-transporting ATPase
VTEVWRFAALGLGAGALYALAAIGLVLVYRGSSVVNFAQGAMGMVGAYVYFEAHLQHGVAQAPSVLLGLLASAALGAAFHLVILRQMQGASTLAKIVATLALLVVLQTAAIWRYGAIPEVVPSMLPIRPVGIFGAKIGEDRVYIFCIVIALTAVLWLVYRFTRFGVATTAVAENPRAAAALAVSPNLIAAANWAIGSALGGLAAILLVPITGLGTANLTYLVIPVLAAAVVGRFSSFPMTVLAGLVIGVAQSEVTRYVTSPGWGTAVPFIIVAVVLLLRGRTVAGKDESFGRMPRLGSGRIAPIPLALSVAVVLLCIWVVFPADWVNALQVQLIGALILVSFVVVTGYAGQLSLMQIGFAGTGALTAGWLVANHGWPFELALVSGVLMAIPVGLVVGLAGVRTRGVYLAILTLGFAISLEAVVFMNPSFAGGPSGYNVGETSIFGIDVSGLFYPKRYATFALIALVLMSLMVSNLRRSRAGRRLISVRTNERAAAALGVSVMQAKLYAFVLGGMIASLGGILLAFRSPEIQLTNFAGLQSVTAMQNAVFGGAGTLAGPVIGSSFQGDALGQQAFGFLGARVSLYLAMVSGVGLLLMLTKAPDGLAFLALPRGLQARLSTWIGARRGQQDGPASLDEEPLTETTQHRVPPLTLDLRDVSVRFGGVVALDRLSLKVRPGEIVGLIGPNGAGKSTTIDVITGFITQADGEIFLADQSLTGWSRERRTRAGIGRSFQSLELFDDLTVRENLQTACDRHDVAAYATNLIVPDHDGFTAAALTAVQDFGLGPYLEVRVSDLDHARRRLLAVARAVAGGHSVLLLDEPAAGLGEPQTRHLGQVLRRLAEDRGMAIFLVEHNIDLVLRTCDRVYALNFGSLIGSGTAAEVRSDPAVVQAYLGTSRFTAPNVDQSPPRATRQQRDGADPAGPAASAPAGSR